MIGTIFLMIVGVVAGYVIWSVFSGFGNQGDQ